MTILRLLNVQGIAGAAVSLCLAVLLALQKVETGHWKQQSAHFEQLYGDGQNALATTEASYRAAAEVARAADLATAQHVVAQQQAINEGSQNAFETRLADARARAERLRVEDSVPATDRGPRPAASVSGLPAAAGGASQAAEQAGFSAQERLTATEQAIQLDELIKWVRQQHAVAVSDEASKAVTGTDRVGEESNLQQ